MKTFKEAKVPCHTKWLEAICRLDAFEVAEESISCFLQDEGIPFCVYCEDEDEEDDTEAKLTYIPRHLFRDDDPDKETPFLEDIVRFERMCNVLVYYVIGIKNSSGCYLSYLFVSDDIKEWEEEKEDINVGFTSAWTEDRDHLKRSRFAYVDIFLTEEDGLMHDAW